MNTGEFQQPKKSCSVDECDRATYARGLCAGHYTRLYTVGDVRADVPLRAQRRRETQPESCPVVASGRVCDRPISARGLCKTHYDRLRRFGDVQADQPIRTYRHTESDAKPASRYRMGDRTKQARTAKAAADRRYRRRKRATVLTHYLRTKIVERVTAGEHINEVCADLGVTTDVVWSCAKDLPVWGNKLDEALTQSRDPNISHGTEYSYKTHRCRCPECRVAKAAYRWVGCR